MLALVVVAAVALGYMAFQAPVIGLMPYLKSRKAKLAEIDTKREELRACDREIRQSKHDAAEHVDVLTEIGLLSNTHLLHPRNENYELVATEIVERHARNIGIPVSVTEILRTAELPGITTLKVYKARVTTLGPYYAAVALVAALEKENPYLAITKLSVSSRGVEDKDNHSITFDIHWPRWTDEATGEELLKQIDELTKSENGDANEEPTQ